MQRFSLIRQIASRWLEHDNARSAAAIAYYAIFTLAPTLVVVTVVASRFLGSESAQEMIVQRTQETFGLAGGKVAESILANEKFFRTSVLTPVVSGLLLLYGSSLMFYHLRSALNRIFECRAVTSRDALISALIGRLLAALFVIGAGGLLVATLVTNVALSRMTDWLNDNTPLQIQTWHLLESAVSVVTVALVFVAALKLLPSERPPLRCVLPGASVAVVLFVATKWLIGLYISRSVVASAYGPSSSIVALVLWIYLSTQILLFGAEICGVSMDRREPRDGTTKNLDEQVRPQAH